MRSLLISCAILLAIPSMALPQRCGPNGCSAPTYPTVQPKQPAQAAPGKLWWKTTDANYGYLFRDNMQVGLWIVERQKYLPLQSYEHNVWGRERDDAPIPVPRHLLRMREPLPIEAPKLEAFQLNGVADEKIGGQVRERHTVSGHEVTESDGLAALSGARGPLPEDKDKLFLCVLSKDKAKRDKVVADLQADPVMRKWVSDRCHLVSTDPDHSMMVDRDKKTVHNMDADLVVSLIAPDRTELWHDAGYQQGPLSLQGMRKRDPNYRPDEVPGPNRPSTGTSNTTYYVIGAALVLAVLLLRKDPNKP